MNDESDVSAQAEALHQLIAAMRACDDARIPRAEILEIVRPHLLEDDDIALEGSVMEHLGDRDATQIIQIIYEALLSGASFTFVDGRRMRNALLALCDGLGEVTFDRDGKKRRVTITKPPS